MLLLTLCALVINPVLVIAQQGGGVFVPPPSVTGPRDAKPSTRSASISGRVIGGDSGLPLPRAVVRVSGDEVKEQKTAVTDQNGRYVITDLPAGRLQLMASKAGYVMLAYGQRRPLDGGKPIDLREGQRLDGVNFNLPRGGVITGRVTDEFGEPVAGMGIQAMRYVSMNGKRTLVPASMDSTDDLGRFRIYGLTAADYYVCASGQGFGVGGPDDDAQALAPTYFPGTASVASAQRVRVAAGTETAGVNFALAPARGVHVRGIVTTSQGRAAHGFVTMFLQGEAVPFLNAPSARLEDDGTFSMANVLPGDYLLRANAESTDGMEAAALPVTVAGHDISDVALVTAPPAIVAGQVVFETAPAATVQPSDINFMAQPRDWHLMTGGEVSSIKEDWTFEAKLPDPGLLLRAVSLPPGWILKAVLMRGVDVTETGIDVRPGERLDGLQVLLTNRVTSVSGGVTDDRGAPLRDYVVLVFAADPARWTPFSRFVDGGRPDQQGRYVVKGLPAGEYLAVALDDIDEGRGSDPEFLTQLQPYATPFTLGEGEQKTVTLKLTRMR